VVISSLPYKRYLQRMGYQGANGFS